MKNFRQFALAYLALAKDENISAFFPAISISLSMLQIRQPLAAEFELVPQNLFPALQNRELQNPSLSWQLFVSHYMVALPSEATLKQWLIEEQDRLKQQFDFGS